MQKYSSFIFFLLALCACQSKPKEIVTLFAGVGMTDVVNEIAETYKEKTGVNIELNLASSAVLAKQIEAGAPGDVIIFASKHWANYSENKNLVIPNSRKVIARNNIVLVAPKNSPLSPFKIDNNLNLPKKISGEIAIGDPDAVPAGKYFMQCVEYYGWENGFKNRYIYAQDVRTALFYSEMGEVSCSVVFASDAIKSKKIKVIGTFPEESHKPIQFISFKVKDHNKLTNNFYNFFISKQSLKIWQKHGFLPSN